MAQPPLQELIIKNFLGQNTKASAYDIEHHQCRQITNFEISKIIGSLYKSFGYKIATAIIGNNYIEANKKAGQSGLKIGTLHEWRTGLASPQDSLFVVWDSANQEIVYWNNGVPEWTRLDSGTSGYTKGRFFTRDGSLLVAGGTASTDIPRLIDYYPARTIFSAFNQSAGFYETYANRFPWDSQLTFETWINAGGGGNLRTGEYYAYYAALVYDDGQIGEVVGPLDAFSPYSPTGDDIAVRIIIYVADWISSFNRRATGIALFRSHYETWGIKSSTPYIDSYYLGTIPLNNQNMPVIASGQGQYIASGTYVFGGYGMPNHLYDYFYLALWQSGGDDNKIYKRIINFEGNKFYLENGTGLVDLESYMYDIVTYWWHYTTGNSLICYFLDDTQELTTSFYDRCQRGTKHNVPINYSYALSHDKRMWYAPVYDVKADKLMLDAVGISNINGEGFYEYDVIPNVLKLGAYGVEKITGLGRILDFIILFTYTDIFKINVSSGSVFAWELVETLENVGVIAPDSLTYIWGVEFKYSGWFYRSADGYRVYDGYRSTLISFELEEENAIPFTATNPEEAVGEFNPLTRQWIVSYPTDGKIHKLDLISGEWLTSTFPDEVDAMCVTRKDRLLTTDEDTIFCHTHDTDEILLHHGSYDISPLWFSKFYNCQLPGITKVAKFLIVTYKSNTWFYLRWNIDGGSYNYAFLNEEQVLCAESSLKTKVIPFPTSVRFDTINFYIAIPNALHATNTSLQIDEIRLQYYVDVIDRSN